jgi:hypothetical protein
MLRLLCLCLIWCYFTSCIFAAEVDFAHEIVPLLKSQCGKCHSGSQKKGNFSINLRETFLAGGESGPAVKIGKSEQSELIARITTADEATRMPPEGERLTEKQVALLKRWIDEGAKWEEGYSFGPRIYDPPLQPRKPELPAATAGRENPVDRILDHYLATNKIPPPKPLDDAAFVRRAYLDLIGLLPTPEELQRFELSQDPQRRNKLVRELLQRDVDYAEHWLTFWNDLLRNDYAGTGFITGGRKQISKWLYQALVTNKPYDQFARELIAPPTAESAGFADGIRWRGEVSAGQTVEIQFAQSVGQSLLGINLKCASCHDSFIDRWTLEESYGLAAIYASQPLQLHRCDKPLGKTAQASWLFPELGQVDAKAPQPERLKQLAALMTHPENGRFTRTIVNRLWHRLMGRGIVHPTDAMQTAPWNADLLDYLAVHLTEHKYDLKATLELIATSQAYQSQAEVVTNATDAHGYHYAGPRSKRLTAEQFLDCVWQVTEAAPAKMDAPIVRGKVEATATPATALSAKWIWNKADVSRVPANETLALRKKFDLKTVPAHVTAVVTCDNSFTLYVNNQKVAAGENWESPTLASIGTKLKAGANEILIVAKNGGSGENPAACIFEARWQTTEGKTESLVSDASWEWSAQLPQGNGKYKTTPTDWQAAAVVATPEIWNTRVAPELAALLNQGASAAKLMVRASLLKSDVLMRALGRPNRDQIVSDRPTELNTLEAMELANGQGLNEILNRGAKQLASRQWQSTAEFSSWLYRFALSRQPTAEETAALQEVLGNEVTAVAVEDVLWSVLTLPEFQLVR